MQNAIPVLLNREPADDDPEHGLRRFFHLVRRRFALMATIFVVVLAAAVLALLLIPPTYTASVLVLVDPAQPDLLGSGDVGATQADSARVDSEVELVRAEPTIAGAIESEGLLTDPEFGPWPGAVRRALVFLHLAVPVPTTGEPAVATVVGKVNKALSVQRRGLSDLIAVSVKSKRPAKAASLANAIAASYIRQQVPAKTAAILASRNALAGTIDDARAAVSSSERALDDFVTAKAPTMKPDSPGLLASLPVDARADFLRLQQTAELARTQYQTMLARLSELDAAAPLQLADSRVVAEATAPVEPSFPQPVVFLVLGAVVGIVLAIGLAYLAENIAGGFVSETEMQAALGAPVAGTIPRQRRPGVRGSLADWISAAPNSGFAESVRRIRASVDLALRRTSRVPASGAAVVMVSSALSGDGVSTLSLALGRSIAQAGKKTLLIETGLGRGAGGVSAETGGSPSGGGPHADFFAGSETGLSILAAGNGGDFADAGSFERLLSGLAGSFDVIVLDAPAAGVTVDPVWLSQYADVILFVVRSRRTSRQGARAAIDALLAAKRPGSELLAVLNDQHPTDAPFRGARRGAQG